MKRLSMLSMMLGALGVLSSPPAAETGAKVAVRVGPTIPKQDVVVVRTRRNVIWVPGYHRCNTATASYEWVAGKWIEPKPGFIWVEGRWKQTRHGWIYVEEHWRKV